MAKHPHTTVAELAPRVRSILRHISTQTIYDALSVGSGLGSSVGSKARTIGSRGLATLENYQFLEKVSHFDREPC